MHYMITTAFCRMQLYYMKQRKIPNCTKGNFELEHIYKWAKVLGWCDLCAIKLLDEVEHGYKNYQSLLRFVLSTEVKG